MPYPNDLPQEVDRRAAKCISCNLQFVNTLTDSISYADAVWLVPKCSCDFKATSNIISRFLYNVTGLSRHFIASWLGIEQHWLKIACVGWRWFLSMHRNDTVEHVITEAVFKRGDSSGNRKIHLVFTDLVLSFEIIQ
jgi:hypothetical protein